MVLIRIVTLALLVLWATAARAAEVPIPPSPTTWVTDTAGLLSATTKDTLESRLLAYNKSTGHQVIVWIGTTTGDTPLEDWTIHAFTDWKVGRKKLDDGAALFLFTADRKARIEVGYGLEPVLTDAIASQIIRNDIVPNMRQGNGDAAVTSAVSAMLGTIGGENGAAPNPQAAGQNGPSAQAGPVATFLLIFAFIVFFIIITAMARAMRGGRYYSIGSGPFVWTGGWGGGGGSWGGGGDSGGGGFSGGGGMGGGGGASGGW